MSSPRSKSLPKGLISVPLSYIRGFPGTLFYSLNIPLKCSDSGIHNSHFLVEQDLCQELRAGVLKPSGTGMKDLFACLAYFHRVLGTTVVLSHLADHVTSLWREGKREENWGLGPNGPGQQVSWLLPHFILKRV